MHSWTLTGASLLLPVQRCSGAKDTSGKPACPCRPAAMHSSAWWYRKTARQQSGRLVLIARCRCGTSTPAHVCAAAQHSLPDLHARKHHDELTTACQAWQAAVMLALTALSSSKLTRSITSSQKFSPILKFACIVHEHCMCLGRGRGKQHHGGVQLERD